ncbi:MAG: ornithine cyclodeaminase family protein [Legionella sp.]|uniref:ornithine cyclodeaminase family protein n=1 Tax=Legionella sp. TaxID=459 RepID=UPI00284F993A|nr:ornithine cyclodeaminase family protein [Legionella sp.]
MTVQLLSLNDVKQSINMLQAIEAMERAFIQLAENQVKLPLRTGITIDEEQALTLTMPAYLAADKALGLKVVSIFPNNSIRNKPSITGFIMLLDAQTGEPKALMDAGFLTALRTGAVSGLATKYFARENASHAAIIGSGVQAETQLEAITAVRDITQVSVWSRDLKKAQNFADKFAGRYEIKAYKSISLAVQHADIICTATGSNEPLIHLEDLQDHVHINAIGSHTVNMKEIDNEVLGKALVIADQLGAVLAESGEIMSAIAHKQLQPESIMELGTWLLHKNAEDRNRLTVFKSVGLSIQDVSVASVVYQNAMMNNLGTSFALS